MDKIINFILYPQFTGKLFVIRAIFIAISLISLYGIYFFLKDSKWLRHIIWEDLVQFFTWKPFETRKFLQAWQKINKRLEKGLESEYKLAVIEADSILNDVVKRMGYATGDSLGERLDEIGEDILTNIEEVREAHNVRNDIVHDLDYQLTLERAKEIISIYEKALAELEAL